MISPDIVLRKLPRRLQIISVLFGGFLVYCAVGGLAASIGNVLPYVTSYLKSNVNGQASIGYNLIIWLSTISDVFTALSGVLGGMLEKKLGPRWTVAIGLALLTIGAGTSYFSVQYSFWLWVFTYGALPGAGLSIATVPAYVCAIKWLPNNKGLSNGVTLLGLGVGPFIFNFVQTAFVNPWNFSPDSSGYFTQQLLLTRVPMLFVVLAAMSLGLGLIGWFLLMDPVLLQKEEPNVRTPLLSAVRPSEDSATEQQSNSLPENPSAKLVLRSGTFWYLWISQIFLNQPTRFISSYYKAFGQTFISNDALLAALGSTSAVTGAIGLVVFGHLGDKFSYQSITAFAAAGVTALMATVCVTQYAGQALYFIWICVIFFIQSAPQNLFSVAIARAFGNENCGFNYGLLITGMVLGSPLTALLTTFLLNSLGYCGMFLLVSGFAFFAFCITLIIHRTKYGARIGMGKKQITIKNKSAAEFGTQ